MGNSNVRARTLSIDNDLAMPSAGPAAAPQQAAVPEPKPEGSFDPEGDPAAQLEAALAPLKRRLSRDASTAPPPQLTDLAECLRSRKGGLCCLQPTQSFVEMANALPAAT